jgi:Spy/CpxP family protein refolding chaperone
MLSGLALMLALAMPVAAEPPNMALAASEAVQDEPEMLLANYDGMGSGGNHPGMRAAGRHGGWQRGFGHSRGHHRPSFVGMVLMNREQLGLTTQQVDSLRKLGMDSRRAAIRRRADLQTAKLDLMSLRWSEPVDMGKVEVKVREIEKLKGDGMIEAFRTADAAKAQLTAEQREKLKSLRAARWQRRGSGEGGGMDAPDSDRMR